MTMKDDYLWDGSGDPDPDVEKLEGLLGRFRSERPAPVLPEAPVVPFRPRRTAVLLPYLAAAAAVVLSVSLGLWWARSRPEEAAIGELAQPAMPGARSTGGGTDPKDGPKPEVQSPPARQKVGPKKLVVRPPAPATRDEVVAAQPAEKTTFTPLVDVATAGHIEQAELLLRSFRNASVDDADALVEVAFDAKQSRELLDQNAFLRRTAAAKKNVPVDRLLGDLEPFLLDIANLGDRPSRDDVHEIQQRLEHRDVLSDLELYSYNRPAQGF
jgi:hypothetical protein